MTEMREKDEGVEEDGRKGMRMAHQNNKEGRSGASFAERAVYRPMWYRGSDAILEQQSFAFGEDIAGIPLQRGAFRYGLLLGRRYDSKRAAGPYDSPRGGKWHHLTCCGPFQILNFCVLFIPLYLLLGGPITASGTLPCQS